MDYDSHPGRFRGHGIDLLPLSQQGVADAETLAARLEESGGLDLIVTSSMARAMHTAMVVSGRLGIRVEVELDVLGDPGQPDVGARLTGRQLHQLFGPARRARDGVPAQDAGSEDRRRPVDRMPESAA